MRTIFLDQLVSTNNVRGLLLVCCLSLAACTSQPVPVTNPLALPHVAANTLVQLENSCEDPVVDAQTLTMNEALADVFAFPYNLAMVLARTVAIFAVGVPMAVVGYEPETINGHIAYALPFYRAGPDPRVVKYHGKMVDVRYRPCEGQQQ